MITDSEDGTFSSVVGPGYSSSAFNLYQFEIRFSALDAQAESPESHSSIHQKVS
jgi:hypothetical protein